MNHESRNLRRWLCLLVAALALLGTVRCSENTAPERPPLTPSNLTATATAGSATQIDLTWQDNATNEDGFRVERAPGGTTSFAEIATVGSNATSYQSTGLTPGTSYSYRVRAYNAVGPSDYSNTATATTLSVPTKLGFTVQPSTTVAGQTITPAVKVAIQDAGGNTVTTATSVVTLAIGTNPASGTLSGTTSVAAVNGVATLSNLSINNVGTGYTLTATSGTLTIATSATFDITAPLGVTARSPTPYVGVASFIARTSSFSATFSTTMAAATANTFVVNSSQRGRWFLGGTYGGAGTTNLSTPPASFFPGEEVEEVLTTGLTASSGGAHLAVPLVTRYRVATTAAPASFTAAAGSPVAVGLDPVAVALGDVNGDGKLDLLVANANSNNLTGLLGSGDGTFTAAAGSPVAVGLYPVAVALGDVNGDGKLDLLVANANSNNLTVLLGNGDGTFTAAAGSPVAVGSSPSSVALGDMNGDGKLDLLTANSGSNNVTVLLGNGDGTFTAAPGSPVSVGGGPYSVVLGDVNGDGKLDLLLANGSSNNLTVLLGNGDGTFTAAAGGPVFFLMKRRAPGSGDFPGAGNFRSVTANLGSNNATVLLGNGDGTFTAAAGSPVTVGSGPLSVALGDVN